MTKNDPWDSAQNAKPRPQDYYGQVDLDVWFCALVKGKGRVPFDPQQHERRSTAIDLTIAPISDMGLDFAITRNMLDWTREWAGMVLPSIKALAVESLRKLNGKWVHVEMVPTGETYTGKDGQEKAKTTFNFLAVYDTEEVCREAFHADRGTKPESLDDEEPVPGFEPTETDNSQNANERETARRFLEVLVQQHKDNPEGLKVTIDAMPMIAKYFSFESEETQILLKEAQGGTN